MRILFIIHQFMPEFSSGTEQITLNLAKSAQRDGHHVEVLTCSLQGSESWQGSDTSGMRFAVIDGVPVYAAPSSDISNLAQLGLVRDGTEPSFDRFFDSRERFDVVHITHSMRVLTAIEAVRARQIPYIITLTDFFLACYRINLIRESGNLCSGPQGGEACAKYCSTLELNGEVLHARQTQMRSILTSASAVVACSEYVASVFRTEYPDIKVWTISHGIDLLRFERSPRKQKREKVAFGYIGTLSDAKGVHILAEAFARAAPQNAVLKLVGPCYDDNFLQSLRDLTGGSDAISIHPGVMAQQIPATLATFDLLCLPSLVPETFSLAIHEGFAAGLPCLVSDLGNPAKVVRRDQCGQTIPAGDVVEWEGAIQGIVDNPSILDEWRARVPLPMRVEEEGFLYAQLYRGVAGLQRDFVA